MLDNPPFSKTEIIIKRFYFCCIISYFHKLAMIFIMIDHLWSPHSLTCILIITTRNVNTTEQKLNFQCNEHGRETDNKNRFLLIMSNHWSNPQASFQKYTCHYVPGKLHREDTLDYDMPLDVSGRANVRSAGQSECSWLKSISFSNHCQNAVQFSCLVAQW